ncbi:MAG: tRNA (adenosine(37)-N6)-dimethylallyltransferase MiaA [Desulfobacterales bacterium]
MSDNAIKKTKIVVICGPTAVGKTSQAIKIAKIFDGEIINADSRQIYRFMNIGTAKPSPEQLSTIPHYLVDFINPDQPFDANRFAEMAHEIVSKLTFKKKLPLLVGGTGFYIKSTLHGLFENNCSNPMIRRRLQQEANRYGKEYLYEKLKKVDPETANRIHANDTYRVIRALEVYKTSGETISSLHRRHHFAQTRYNALKIGFCLDRKTLYKRIDQRVDIMISEGLIEEVQALLALGYPKELKSMKAIGYNHLADYLAGNCTLEEAICTLKRDTRRYAKRQMTWFRPDPEINWVKPSDTNALINLVQEFLKV